MSLYLKWVSWRWHIVGPYFFKPIWHSAFQLRCLNHLHLIWLLIRLSFYLFSTCFIFFSPFPLILPFFGLSIFFIDILAIPLCLVVLLVVFNVYNVHLWLITVYSQGIWYHFTYGIRSLQNILPFSPSWPLY